MVRDFSSGFSRPFPPFRRPLAHQPRLDRLSSPLKHSWLSAVRTLGALSSLDPKDVGLENFGSHKPYFPRQIKSLSKVSLAQAAVTDVNSGTPVGEIPSWRELIAWYERNLPDERKTGVRIVHGDYKLDNLVFHPYRVSLTNGLQLADLANLTQPWVLDPNDLGGRIMVGYKNSPDTEPISLAELERDYCQVTRQPYPIAEMSFARSWMLFRVCHHSFLRAGDPVRPSRHVLTYLSFSFFSSSRSSRRELRHDMRDAKRVRSRRISTPTYFP